LCAKEDQLLELHTNLTFVQEMLLQVLQSHWKEATSRETQQREVQKQWTEFTTSLEERLGSISANTSNLMGDLFSGLLRLQSFTRGSMKFVADEFRMLEGDVKDMRDRLGQVHDNMELIATGGVSKVQEFAEMSQRRLSMVLSLAVVLI
jgi:hypothetical protein